MTTSGSFDYSVTRQKIGTRALKHLGVISAGETPSDEDMADVVDTLQSMVKLWQASGTYLWKKKEGILFLTKGTAKYSLGGSAKATKSYTSTTTSAAASSGASTITVASISGVSNADNIGVVQDDGTIHWTTVNGAPSGSTITLTDVLTDDVASGNNVYAYTTGIQRPLKVSGLRWHHVVNDQDTPFADMISREEYFDLPNKTSQGQSVQAYYDPQLSAGDLYLWPAPNSVDALVKFTFREPIEDFDSAANTPDFPQEWITALEWNLAAWLITDFGVIGETAQRVEKRADLLKNELDGWDTEDTSIFMEPGYGR